MQTDVMIVIKACTQAQPAERALAYWFLQLELMAKLRGQDLGAVRWIAHGAHAFEFDEKDFFTVRGRGRSRASHAFALCLAMMRPGRAYELLYVSDGENELDDRPATLALLRDLGLAAQPLRFAEVVPGAPRQEASEMRHLFTCLARRGVAAQSLRLSEPAQLWIAR